ncbi:hypothetical protein GHT06_002506 [Daphnia sinensis]|uniref:Integrase zinc-binding domain-containing protein n=1 Tax=Daphnia sinensis TaxID=1820382 RepID=A0AAD5KWK8_9CRUS|nr:hypothetical protein GHT06_002506 [Daphnia sinensis]
MANLPVSTWTLEACKTRQRVLRFRITGCHTRISNIVTAGLSRRDAEKHLADVRGLLGELENIHDRIIELIDDDDVLTQQNVQHLTYAKVVDNCSSLVENYLLIRQDDDPSVVIETPEEIARRQALQTAEQRLREARTELAAAEQAVIDLGGTVSPTDGSEVNPSDSVSSVGNKPTNGIYFIDPVDSTQAPDAWIDIYLTGREKPHVREKGGKSSVTVQLEVYSGRALDWFSWISMWYALVHITGKTASEKLAILKNFLKGDLADIVHGHGGGESGYKEALQRLRSTCGNRTVIRAAHLQALDRMEAPKNDPQSFKHIIERLALKLQLTDRLEWNHGRGEDLERRTINDFGRWLTTRAVAYQNAYAIADYQQHPAPPAARNHHPHSHPSHHRHPHQQKRSAHTFHGAFSSQKEHGSTERKEKRPAETHCFKCEGAHRLEDCTFFKELPVSDRLTFTQRRGLCYGCFGVRHGAMNCTFKKACGVNGSDPTLQLAEQVRRFCDTESYGTEFKSECMSAEHQRAVTKLETETEKLSVGYAAPVLWIDDAPPEFPDSRRTAETRLKSLRNKFARNPGDYEAYYRAAMEKNFSEGYARRLTPEEIQRSPSRYFLPHFGVPKMAGRPELLTFGVTCSPYVAIRTTWRAADDAGPDMKEAADGVREDIYVDDYLASTGRLEDAYTRVGLLAQVAGLFDPLGTAAPMTVKAKIKLRELGVKGLQWDDPVIGEDKEWWEQYFQKIGRLKEIELPRCIFPKVEEIVRTELHTFADASEEACAASCYTRVVYQDGRVLVRHVKTATKLAPLKTVSVCKLELNAGLMGARLAKFVQTALKRELDGRYFWTDSSTVRNWVRAVSSHYQVYVSHRIGEIQTLTEPHEWRFVPGRLNPADAATRSQMEEEEIPSWWLDGPPFLYEDEAAWPTDLPWMTAKEELRSIHVHLNSTAVEQSTAFNWKDVKITANDIPALIRLEGEFLNHVRRSQREVYPEELKRLQQEKSLRPTSPLLPLTPFLDEFGVLRLGGRLSRAKLPYDVLHPPILSGKHPFSRMIIRAFHESMHHLGTDFVLSHVRQHFWVTAGRELVKRIRNECVPCRRFRPKAALQMMADVHRARLGAGHPPFTYTSVDYFGP